MKSVAKWCWSGADRGLGYSLCLCLVRVLRLDVKFVARELAYSLCLCLCLVRVFRLGVKCDYV